ncbi:hypothetical protein AAH678_28200 [Sodalis endosymbiont of Spalangia cameroni]|uniref:hypothetical protein n=1 Tax=Sodalis praecaptivus TaxID=1239307 RepID=UPI0031F88553
MMNCIPINTFRSANSICNKALKNPSKYLDIANSIIKAKQGNAYADLICTHSNPKKETRVSNKIDKYEMLLQKLSQVSNASIKQPITPNFKSILKNTSPDANKKTLNPLSESETSTGKKKVAFACDEKKAHAMYKSPVPTPRTSLNRNKNTERLYEKPVPAPRKSLNDKAYKEMCDMVNELSSWHDKNQDTSRKSPLFPTEKAR